MLDLEINAVALKLCINTHPFNLHPEKCFERLPCKIYPIFYRVPPEKFLRVVSNQIFFQGAQLIISMTPNFLQAATLKKIWVEATLKKSQLAPYKNMGRFYRVQFKSLLSVQIKRATVVLYHLN